MQKNSTHLITKECNGTQQSSVKPRKSTIEFLKQAQRFLHVEEAFSIKNHTFPSNRRIFKLKTVYNRVF